MTFLADAYHRRGALSQALPEARAGAAGPVPLYTGLAASVLARIHLDLREPEKCLLIAEPQGSLPAFAADLLTSKALAFRNLGREQDARASLTKARDILLGVAEGIQDPEIRHAFVTNVDECARTLTLAREWSV